MKAPRSWREEQLLNLNLLQAGAAETYQFHPLVRRFCQAKLQLREDGEALKRQFCRGMVAEAKTIPYTPTKEQVEAAALSIPHLAESATELQQWLEDEDLIWAFLGLARYYEGQGLYDAAVPWYKQCLVATRERLGESHPDVASSLNNLAGLYHYQGRYEEAEPLLQQALEIAEKVLGKNHPNTVTIRQNLESLP
jgi:tetratricopeptide (TPR) repeat protein